MRLGNTGRAGAQRCHLTKLREVQRLFSPRSQLSLPPEERFRRQLEYERLIVSMIDGTSPLTTFCRVTDYFGLSHKDLADELMCSERTIHRWFGSRAEWPTLRSVLMFSVAFCLDMTNCVKLVHSLNYFMRGEDAQFVEMLLRCYAGEAVEVLPYLETFSLKSAVY